MSAENALISILQSRVPTSFVLRGPWGRGKTHLWKKLVSETQCVHWNTYSYVSLFGLNSIDELKAAIFESSCAPSQAHQKQVDLSLDIPVGDVQKELKRNWRSMLKAVTSLDIPSVGNVAPIFQSLVFYGVRRRLICLDDIERRGNGLALKDVLGFVSLLCEERHCAVVVITNDRALDESDLPVWKQYQEKVFRGEVVFDPGSSQCIDLALSESWQDDLWLRGLGKVLNEIGVSNVRLALRAKAAVEALRDRLQGVSDDAALKIARSVGCIVYFRCGQGEGAPPLERAMQRNLMFMAGAKEDSRTAEERRWDAVLADLDFVPDGIDHAVSRFVCNGFVDSEFLRSQVDLFEEARKSRAERRRWEQAWSAYRGNFRCQERELEAMFLAALSYAKHVSAMDIDATAALLRSIGADTLADQFISDWIHGQKSAGNEIFLEDIELFGEIQDPVFRLEIAQAQQAAAPALSLSEIFRALANRTNTEQALAQLATADADEVEGYITRDSGHHVRKAIGYVLGPQADRAHLREAREILHKVATNLSAISALNARRLKQMGFELD